VKRILVALSNSGLDDAKASATGSIKFDIGITGQASKNTETLKVQLTNYDFVWVAGSTHPKEHEQVLEAHRQLIKNSNSLLIIAPRHMEQFKPVAELLSDSKIAFAERSKNNLNGQPVLLADSMGELVTLFWRSKLRICWWQSYRPRGTQST
jgi:3-deoxy-D-manno-octulosonic-acid transferase